MCGRAAAHLLFILRHGLVNDCSPAGAGGRAANEGEEEGFGASTGVEEDMDLRAPQGPGAGRRGSPPSH